MPNHVTNRLEFVGDSEKIEALREYIAQPSRELRKGEEMHIDFNNIIKMDEFLVEWYNAPRVGDVILKKEIDKKLKEEYNTTSGYDWCNTNWGTKWNAYEQYEICDDTIEFQTAWSHPFPLVERLSMMYPDVTINVMYADEALGQNAGTYTIKNGGITNESDEDDDTLYDIYFEMGCDDADSLLDMITVTVLDEGDLSDSLVTYIFNRLDVKKNYDALWLEHTEHRQVLEKLYKHFILKDKLTAFVSDEEEKEG